MLILHERSGPRSVLDLQHSSTQSSNQSHSYPLTLLRTLQLLTYPPASPPPSPPQSLSEGVRLLRGTHTSGPTSMGVGFAMSRQPSALASTRHAARSVHAISRSRPLHRCPSVGVTFRFFRGIFPLEVEVRAGVVTLTQNSDCCLRWMRKADWPKFDA